MGTWNKLGHVDKNCKPCNDPPVPQCFNCVNVKGCGTNFGDGTHNPVPGALVQWSWHGDTTGKYQGSCVTDAQGNCCAVFPAPPTSYTDKQLLMTITAQGYETYTSIVNCVTPNPATTAVILNPNKTFITFHLVAQYLYQTPVGCATITWPGGECTTDSGGQCTGWIDLTKANTVTYSCPPTIADATNTLGPLNPTPCKITSGYPMTCTAGFEPIGANLDPFDKFTYSGILYCLSHDGLTATIAGQSIPLAWLPARGVWGGCGTLPAYTTIDWVPCPLCGGCGGGQENYITRDLPFSVIFDTNTVIQISAPICSKVHGLPSKLDIHQSYMYDGTNAPANPVGVYASCSLTQWPMLQFSGGPGGGPGCTYCIYGETINTGAAVYVDVSGWDGLGDSTCGPFAAKGTIPPGLQGVPAYIINPFAGPVTVTDALGRRGGPVARSGGGGGPAGGSSRGRGGPVPALVGGPAAGPVVGHGGRAGPSLARKAVNFAGAAAVHMAHGRPQTPANEAARRIAICEGCTGEGGYWDAARRGCLHPQCGCNMDLKVTWADMSCPIGRWPAVAASE